MGDTHRGETGSLIDRPLRTSRSTRQPLESGSNEIDVKHSRTVTESDNSDTETKKPSGSLTVEPLELDVANRRKNEPITTGIQEDEGKPGSSEACADKTVSLPLHEQIKPVEPLDISYSATPQSLKLRDILMHRLDVAVHTGRIQVVSVHAPSLTTHPTVIIAQALIAFRLTYRGEDW